MKNEETISSFDAIESVTKLLAELLVASREEGRDIRNIALEMSLILYEKMAEIIEEREIKALGGMPF